MKVRYIVALMLGCLFTVSPVWAQDETQEWNGNNVGDMTFNQSGTVLIYLKGDITISGTITLDGPNTTVRFVNTSGKEVTIHNGSEITREISQPMFNVINGAKLAFNYKDAKVVDDEVEIKEDGSNVLDYYQPIVIDGGAAFENMSTEGEEWDLNAINEGYRFKSSVIHSVGALELYHVTIRNYYQVPNGSGVIGAIGLATRHFFNEDDTGKPYGYTKLINSIIEKCKSRCGVAINVDRAKNLDVENINPNDDGHLITLKNCSIKNCVASGDNDGWGGMIRFKGGSMHSLYLKDCVFEENFSYGDGAGLWWNAAGHKDTRCTIDGCTFKNNRAMRECGAIRLETTFEFTGATTTVSGNKCFGKGLANYTFQTELPYENSEKANGGGISIYGYASDAYDVGGEFDYILPECLVVENNYAKGSGGGIAFDFTGATEMTEGTVVNAYFNGAKISNNKSDGNGGGVYFRNETKAEKNYKFNIYLNSGTIEENEAPEGGGMYVSDLDIVDSDGGATSKIKITYNEATDGSGGGIYLVDGSVSLNNANIQNNKANVQAVTSFAGGGGVYVENGSFTISEGEISENTSTSFGGGVLVKSGTVGEENLQAVTLSGGIIKNNKAHYGGGLAALGNLSLTLNQVNIENNTALNGNGGGVFVRGGITAGLADKATLTYNAGIVRQNKATRTGDKPETAYGNTTGTGSTDGNVTYASVAGMGGGICLGMNTTLQFAENLANFGIYDNEADSGADDLFATENNTVVNLPDVKSMKLQGYDENESHTLFWFEDYITNDPNYCHGTAINKDWTQDNSDNQRYREVRNGIVDGDVYYYTFPENVTSARFEKKYLCLTLGWNVGLIYLIKEGMADGENAIFRILKKQGENDYKEYMTVILTDADKNNDGKRVKQITLNEDGTWKIEETPWSWAYTPPTDPERTLNASSTVAERTFTFTNTPKTGDDVPPHGESVKVNNMNTVQQQ